MINYPMCKRIFLVVIGVSFLMSCRFPWLSSSDETSTDTNPVAKIILSADVTIDTNNRVTIADTLIFNGSSSKAGTGTITDYAWDFGDGSSSTGSSVTHSYAANGTYSATLKVTNSDNKTAEASISILIDEAPIAIISTGDITNGRFIEITLEATGSTDTDGYVASYLWDMGDSITYSGLLNSGETIPPVTHTYCDEGNFTVTLTLTDEYGTPASATINAVINPYDIQGEWYSILDMDSTDMEMIIHFETGGTYSTKIIIHYSLLSTYWTHIDEDLFIEVERGTYTVVDNLLTKTPVELNYFSDGLLFEDFTESELTDGGLDLTSDLILMNAADLVEYLKIDPLVDDPDDYLTAEEFGELFEPQTFQYSLELVNLISDGSPVVALSFDEIFGLNKRSYYATDGIDDYNDDFRTPLP